MVRLLQKLAVRLDQLWVWVFLISFFFLVVEFLLNRVLVVFIMIFGVVFLGLVRHHFGGLLF